MKLVSCLNVLSSQSFAIHVRKLRFLLQYAANHCSIVKRKSLSPHDLVNFVPFTRNQHTISRLGLFDSPTDRGTSVDFDVQIAVLCGDAGHNIVNDLLRVFGSRIVTGDNNQFCLRCSLPQPKTFGAITIPSRAKDADHSASSQPN